MSLFMWRGVACFVLLVWFFLTPSLAAEKPDQVLVRHHTGKSVLVQPQLDGVLTPSNSIPNYKGTTIHGMASWYGGNGDHFAGRPTASGQIFNPKAMTAASKELPLGTTVRVTNLRLGKQVTVVINDRGPYVGNRVIDLSMGAAEQLGFREAGLADVQVEVLKLGKGKFRVTHENQKVLTGPVMVQIPVRVIGDLSSGKF